jgi:ABC-type nitrate/sulfonate/bicarbonate transport system substrate-binding protein
MARQAPLALVYLEGAVLAGPDGDTSARLLPAMLAKNGLMSLAYSLRTVTPEARDRMLAAGEVLAVSCFDATLMFSMRAGGYDTADLRFLYFADHGLDLYTGALVCAQGLIAEEPGLPERLRWVVGEALQACRWDPDKGVGAVMKRRPEADPGLVRDHLMWVLEKNVFPAAERSPAMPPASMNFVMDSDRMATTIAAAKAAAFGHDEPAADEGPRVFDDSTDGLSSILQRVFPSAGGRT